MTEEELYNRYHEIRSTYVEVRFVDGESLIGKLDSFVSGANNEPDEASIYVDCYELFASEISEIVELSDYSSDSNRRDPLLKWFFVLITYRKDPSESFWNIRVFFVLVLLITRIKTFNI